MPIKDRSAPKPGPDPKDLDRDITLLSNRMAALERYVLGNGLSEGCPDALRNVVKTLADDTSKHLAALSRRQVDDYKNHEIKLCQLRDRIKALETRRDDTSDANLLAHDGLTRRIDHLDKFLREMIDRYRTMLKRDSGATDDQVAAFSAACDDLAGALGSTYTITRGSAVDPRPYTLLVDPRTGAEITVRAPAPYSQPVVESAARSCLDHFLTRLKTAFNDPDEVVLDWLPGVDKVGDAFVAWNREIQRWTVRIGERKVVVRYRMTATEANSLSRQDVLRKVLENAREALVAQDLDRQSRD